MTYQELELENQKLRNTITSLEAQLSSVYKLINGFKSERFVSDIVLEQLNLFSDPVPVEVEAPAKETITYQRAKKKHPGRILFL